MQLIVDGDLKVKAPAGSFILECFYLGWLNLIIVNHDFPVQDPVDLDLVSLEPFLRRGDIKLVEPVHEAVSL